MANYANIPLDIITRLQADHNKPWFPSAMQNTVRKLMAQKRVITLVSSFIWNPDFSQNKLETL